MERFRLLTAFDERDAAAWAGSKTRIGRNLLPLFPGERRTDRIVRELAAERALPIKEVAEAFEFFAVARKWVRTPTVVDACAGHGLVGLLFAAFQPEVREVVCIDVREPDAHASTRAAVERAAIGSAARVRYVEAPLERAADHAPAGSALVAVHACGRLTDRCLAAAVALGGPVVVLPCCRDHSLSGAPAALAEALGGDTAYDVHRTYTLEAKGYRVRWRAIPEAITPQNRVLVGVPRAAVASTD